MTNYLIKCQLSIQHLVKGPQRCNNISSILNGYSKFQTHSLLPPVNGDNYGTLTFTIVEIINVSIMFIAVYYHNIQNLYNCIIVNHSHKHVDENMTNVLVQVPSNDNHTKSTELNVFMVIRG